MAAVTLNYPAHRLNGAAWSVVGSLLVFGAIFYVGYAEPPVKQARSQQPIEMQVIKQQKPKQRPVPKERPKPKRSKSAPPTPLANLDMDLAGIELGLPGFSTAQMGGVDQSLLGDTENLVMTADVVDKVPTIRHQTEIEYPARAKAKELEGYVVLSLLIDREGRVAKVKVIEADPPGIFEAPAERTVKQWLFEPARYQGEPVETWANQKIQFSLG